MCLVQIKAPADHCLICFVAEGGVQGSLKVLNVHFKGTRKRGRSKHLKTIIYCSSFPKLCEITKKKKKIEFTDCSGQVKNAKS